MGSGGQFLKVVLACVAAFACLAPSAQAAYPGENGKIAFVRGTNSCDDDIYTINPDGTAETKLTPTPGMDNAPAWSPNGNRLAFHTNRDGGCRLIDDEIYTMNADGTAPTRLTTNNAIVDEWPTWSPDGARLAFVSTRTPPFSGCGGSFHHRHDIYLMNADGTGPTRLTTTADLESQLAWSPTGNEIALRFQFTTLGGEFCEVIAFQEGGYTVDAATGQKVRHDTTIDDWSPDGAQVAVSRDGDIYVGEGNVTNTPNVNESGPAWSPDGQKIAFTTGDLWVMNADGTDRQQLTSTPGVAEYAPDWQPVQRPYVRPAGATPFRVSLVPAFEACTAPNREHGPPLAFGSCAPPQPSSPNLTVGVGDGSPALSRSVGFVRLNLLAGAPGGADDSDVRIRFSLSNVMRASDLSEYTGGLRARAQVRLTDRAGGMSQTTQHFPIVFDVPCVPTDLAADKSLCELVTSLDTLVPGQAAEGTRAIWALDQMKVYDGGPDENPASTGDNSLLAVQGVFVP